MSEELREIKELLDKLVEAKRKAERRMLANEIALRLARVVKS